MLIEPISSVTVYGACCDQLMFFESPSAIVVPDTPQISTTGVVKVTKGILSKAQIVKGLNELAPGNSRWELIGLKDNLYKVDFPSTEELKKLLQFGMCKVSGSECILEFDE